MSAAFSLCADATMMTLGGSLKRRERLSARLGDALSELYLASAVLKRFENEPRDLTAHRAARLLLSPSDTRERLTADIFLTRDASEAIGRIEQAFVEATAAEPDERTVREARRRGLLQGQRLDALAEEAHGAGLVDESAVLRIEEMLAWLADWNRARSPGARVRQLKRLTRRHLRPVFGLLRASLCIGGGQGGAVLVEREDEP